MVSSPFNELLIILGTILYPVYVHYKGGDHWDRNKSNYSLQTHKQIDSSLMNGNLFIKILVLE